MKLLRFRDGRKTRIGIKDGDEVLPVDYHRSMKRLVARFNSSLNEIEDIVQEQKGIPLEEVNILPPISRPGKIVCLGRNYAAHAEESGMSVPDEPIIFPKASSAVAGQGDVIIHHDICERVDHEVELAVIISDFATRTPKEEFLGKIFGYTILNDVSAREMQKRDIDARNPWFRSKSLDTFCPFGPWLTTRDEIGNPQDLELECRVNSQVRQKANTGDMIFPIDELVEFISRHMTLEPGDVISTGTPEGISPIVPGDVVECEVEGLDVLTNEVVEDRRS